MTQRLDADRQAQQQQRDQEIQQKLAERDAAWQQHVVSLQAEWAKQQQERDAARQKEAWQKTRMAKRAAAVNTKGSPGHSTNPKTIDDTLHEIASRHYN